MKKRIEEDGELCAGGCTGGQRWFIYDLPGAAARPVRPGEDQVRRLAHHQGPRQAAVRARFRHRASAAQLHPQERHPAGRAQGAGRPRDRALAAQQQLRAHRRPVRHHVPAARRRPALAHQPHHVPPPGRLQPNVGRHPRQVVTRCPSAPLPADRPTVGAAPDKPRCRRCRLAATAGWTACRRPAGRPDPVCGIDPGRRRLQHVVRSTVMSLRCSRV